MSDRYLRQQAIDGWDQSKLYEASIGVFGSEPLAIQTLRALSMLGFSDIDIYDNAIYRRFNADEFIYHGAAPGTFKVEILEDILKRSSPDIMHNYLNTKMGTIWNLDGGDFALLDNKGVSDHAVIVDATNNPILESLLIKYCHSRNIPMVNASAMKWTGEAKIILPKRSRGADIVTYGQLSPGYRKQPQDPVIAGLIGGVVGDMVRKLVIPLPGETKSEETVHVNFLSDVFVGYEDDHEAPVPNYDLVVDVIGVSGLGLPVAIGLIQRGVKEVRLWDKDEYEELNLNRLFEISLLDDCIGLPKASTTAKIFRKYGKTKIRAYDEYFEGKFKGKIPDAIFRCGDSHPLSNLLNDTATKHNINIPLFYATSTAKSSEAYAAVPGETACLEEVFNISELAERDHVPAGCIEEPDPSVGTTNMIGANAMLSLFDRWAAGLPMPRGYFDYSSKRPNRVAFIQADYKCNHFGGK